MSMKVVELNIYPLKSGKSIILQKANLVATGFQYDRQWMLVDENGHFLTQRKHPHLANISFDPMKKEGIIYCSSSPDSHFHFQADLYKESNTNIVIWGESFIAGTYPLYVNTWFSKILNIKCKLVHIPQTQKRMIFKTSVEKQIQVNFPDGYPLLLVSQSSLGDLNSRLSQPIKANRFRANIVVDGSQPYSEDGWKMIHINKIPVKVVKPCSRCNVINVDQGTGECHEEPLRTLSSYRKFNDGIHFGVNMIHLSEGLVSIGDKIEIIE